MVRLSSKASPFSQSLATVLFCIYENWQPRNTDLTHFPVALPFCLVQRFRCASAIFLRAAALNLRRLRPSVAGFSFAAPAEPESRAHLVQACNFIVNGGEDSVGRHRTRYICSVIPFTLLWRRKHSPKKSARKHKSVFRG